MADFLLNEDGSYILQETGDKILLESSVVISPGAETIVNESMATTPATGTLKGSASWNSGGYLRLTPNALSQDGEIEYSQVLALNFTCTFDVWMGPNNPGADAVYFYFGCSQTPHYEDDGVGGYIIAYDEYSGEGHPMVVQYNGQFLATTNGTSTFSDSAWHTAKITVINTTITMYLDGVQTLQFTDGQRTLGGSLFGWGARTGGVANEHRVRNLVLYYNTPAVVSTPSPQIQLFVSDVVTGNLFELPFTSMTLIDELNNGKQATIALDYPALSSMAQAYKTTVRDLFAATFRELWVTKDGVKIWYGVVSEYNRSKDAAGGYQMSIAAIDYFSLLQKRRTSLTTTTFTNADPASIPWQLINTSQQSFLPYSDFGITQGATASTPLTISISYKNAELRQEIINLSNYKQNGTFDFDIDTTKKFNVYYPIKGSVRPNIVLDDNNILSDTVKIPLLLSLTNSINVTGQGINDDQAAINRKAATSTINAYKLLEDQIADINVSDTGLLAAEGDRFLALNQLPLNQLTLKHYGQDPNITTYDVGDLLTVNVPEEGISYQQYRVKKRTITIDQAGELLVQLDMLLL